MSKHFGNNRIGSAARARHTKKPACFQPRRIGFESLEHRRLLSSVGLSAISNVTLPAGTSVMVALNGSDPGQTVNFGVTSSDPTMVTPTVMPKTNKSVQFNINGLGTMTFQLFDNLIPNITSHIETLVNDAIYNGDFIYRAESGLLVQGGNEVPQISNGSITSTKTINTLPSGVPSTVADEFSPDLGYTAGGVLALATPGADGGGSEFFVTSAAQREWDYTYSIFGFQTVDQAITYGGKSTTVLQALESMSTQSISGIDYLDTPVEINSASIITDTQNGVLMLRAPKGVTGSYTVTVTAFDNGTNTPTTQTFTVNVVADTATGVVTNPWAGKTPAAPTSIAFQPQSGQGTTTITSANNSSASSELQFLVSGVTAGDQVTVYADGVAIGSAAATSTSTVVTTNGTTTLLDGSHTFTATETALDVSASYTDTGSNSRNETANVESVSSPGVQLEVLANLAVAATIPVNVSAGGDVTLLFSGSKVLIYDNIAHTALADATFNSADTVEVIAPAGQANSVLVMLPDNSGAAIPHQVLVQGAAGSTSNQVTVYGTAGANTFTLDGATVTGNGLQTQIANVQKLTLAGRGGNDDYTLDSSSTPTWVVDTGGYNTMDFSQDTAAVAVNLGLDKGQAQAIAPWNTTLSIDGVINKLIGSAYNDDLTGGPAATTMIVAGAGNDTITGGSGDNILIGGGGSDTITGGLGKNLIIGGAGNSMLYAEGSENIIFAGSTNDNSNDQALMNLLEQPSRVSYGYSVRRLLASASNNSALLTSPVTFQDTGAHDTIFGSSINNWFMLGKYGTLKG
ncbi:MAG: peptidylprolyl isomerase [Thermoguttaceae bacterium]